MTRRRQVFLLTGMPATIRPPCWESHVSSFYTVLANPQICKSIFSLPYYCYFHNIHSLIPELCKIKAEHFTIGLIDKIRLIYLFFFHLFFLLLFNQLSTRQSRATLSEFLYNMHVQTSCSKNRNRTNDVWSEQIRISFWNALLYSFYLASIIIINCFAYKSSEARNTV